MDRWEKGMLARSLAGHDKNKVYLIFDMDETYVYLIDGELRTKENPKKKKRIHTQIIKEKYQIDMADDVKVKRILKEYKMSKAGLKEEL